MWRFLLEIDWVDRISGYHLPLDHPLPLLVDRINKLRLSVWDALWVRVVDVPAALAGRAYASPGRATIEIVSDPHFPENVGSWTIEDGEARPATRRPDVRVAVSGLGRRSAAVVRAARAGRARGGSRTGRDREGGRAVPHLRRAMVPRDLLEGTVIVVTGASGRVGGLVAQELDRRGLRFRAVTRNVERLPDLGGAEIALAGYDEPDTLADALEPGDRVFMVSMHEPGTADRAAQGFRRRR